MQSLAPNADDDQSTGGEVAMDEGKEPEARDVRISQLSKISTCPAMKIKPITDHQMTSPPDRRSLNDITSPFFSSPVPSNLVWFPPEQDCESTIPMRFLFIVSFKTGPSELLCI